MRCNAPSPPKQEHRKRDALLFWRIRKDLRSSARERERDKRRRWRKKRSRASEQTRSNAPEGAERLCLRGATPQSG